MYDAVYCSIRFRQFRRKLLLPSSWWTSKWATNKKQCKQIMCSCRLNLGPRTKYPSTWFAVLPSSILLALLYHPKDRVSTFLRKSTNFYQNSWRHIPGDRRHVQWKFVTKRHSAVRGIRVYTVSWRPLIHGYRRVAELQIQWACSSNICSKCAYVHMAWVLVTADFCSHLSGWLER
jgi:hypothetical protein